MTTSPDISSSTDPNKPDAYFTQMLADLKRAEEILRADLSNRHNPFRTDGDIRVKDAQANVDRLHGLIRSYTPQATLKHHKEGE